MTGSAATRALIVHSLEHCLAALHAAKDASTLITLISAEGAARYAGILYLQKMIAQAAEIVPDAPHLFFIDCGTDATLAVAALRSSHKHLVFSGAADEKIRALAGEYNAHIIPSPSHVLDLRFEADITAACRRFAAVASKD